MIKDTLYYQNNYLKEFDAVVEECLEENSKIKIVLNQTAFYPEGGGQPSDVGFIGVSKVIKVEEKQNKIYHIVTEKINVGEKVHCKINFDERFQNMQSHTAEHIVSGIICKEYKTSNIGFHIGKDFVTMDFNTNITEKELKEIEEKANKAIYENIDVLVRIYENEKVKDIDYRSKIDLKEDVRLVEIKDYDLCACCGVHVNKTGEIGIIKLLKVEKYKSGVRIYMLAGKKAVENYTIMYNEVNEISTMLSLKLHEVSKGVSNLLKEIEVLKKDKINLKNIIFENEINFLETKKNIILVKQDLDMNDMKNYCLKLKSKAKEIAGIVCDGKFIMMSDSVDLRESLNELKNNLNIKGGGNKNMIQGQIVDSPEKLIKLMN